MSAAQGSHFTHKASSSFGESKYAPVPINDPEPSSTLSPQRMNDEGEGEEPCQQCTSLRHEIKLLNRDRSLTICIFGAFIVLLSSNLIITTLFYIRDHYPSVAKEGASPPSSYLPSFQTAEITDQECLRRTSSFTPALEAIEYYDTDFDNQFAHRTEYRGPPTKQREQAWLELWHHEGIMIESWQMPMLNRTDLEGYEKVAPEKGDGYIALFEVHHQLHCLNLVRQYTWLLMGSYSEDDIPPDLRESPKANRMHVDHCIETLRLSLMCHGDMSPLLVTMDPNEPLGRKADFNTHHRCRNFTKLQEWTKANGVEDWEKDTEPVHNHL
ncbi:hypothetical protein VM1G_06403 [Cytospora mali]|uniref:Cyclochlorotine biosynthesis protein O n=1 Tax=Cytospora mali TaxID=578113 RepID=A0A194W279_CYTMA|nr:hypothetical protein VM1G_06403 [Valsa mali]